MFVFEYIKNVANLSLFFKEYINIRHKYTPTMKKLCLLIAALSCLSCASGHHDESYS